MRNIKEIPAKLTAVREGESSRLAEADALTSELETNGVVVLPGLLNPEQLRSTQHAFEARLRRVRWNNFEGYQRTELFRHMVEDVLVLDQGFVDLAVHPLVNQILQRYLGTNYRLTEAKGWKSLPTNRDFHGWHGDMWYDQASETEIHREIKLAMYLTDVRSGAFKFIKGSHRKQHPHNLVRSEVEALPFSREIEVTGPAGTAFLFDTSTIHRQGIPMLEPRQAIFYAYHDPTIPLQEEDMAYDRYHPLLLSAAFLGDLSKEDQRILGFGDQTNFQRGFVRPDRPSVFYGTLCASLEITLRLEEIRERIVARWKRTFGPS
jgi:Phytanoyl-CoA dioxygenase (PhyH)